MENIRKLELWPVDLLKADNVTSILVDGERIDKFVTIIKAKREAAEMLKYKHLLNDYAIKKLEKIIDL